MGWRWYLPPKGLVGRKRKSYKKNTGLKKKGTTAGLFVQIVNHLHLLEQITHSIRLQKELGERRWEKCSTYLTNVTFHGMFKFHSKFHVILFKRQFCLEFTKHSMSSCLLTICSFLVFMLLGFILCWMWKMLVDKKKRYSGQSDSPKILQK